MDTPVLLITFNRPSYTRQMLQALKEAKIEHLLIFKDGPRPGNNDDKNASKEIERMIDLIDWECNVDKLFISNNLGCGYGPFTAISWAFSHVDKLIILEDDCIPTKAFFTFCSELLERYKDNPMVRHISGRSPLMGHSAFNSSDYIFTQYAPTWGWATWKRVWDDFDMQMRELKPFFKFGGYKDQFSSKEEAKFFNRRYKKLLKDTNAVFHIWDFQYGLHSRANNSLAIVPSQNLISYIGVIGTHPVSESSSHKILKASETFEIKKHPDSLSLNNAYEKEHFYSLVNINVSFIKRIAYKILKFTKLK